jgi:hypothetical protein
LRRSIDRWMTGVRGLDTVKGLALVLNFEKTIR